MASKIKLGIVGDCCVPTGFATVTHNVVMGLQATGEYDIQVIGINFDGRPNDWSQKIKTWPARLGGDPLGIGVIPQFYNDIKPDCFMMFQDFWNIRLYLGKVPANSPGLFAYYPVDAPNIKGEFMIPMAGCNAVGTYTKFGIQESVRGAIEGWDVLKEQAKGKSDVLDSIHMAVGISVDAQGNAGKPIEIDVPASRLSALRRAESYVEIPHGIDTTQFKPIPRRAARKMLGINVPADAFIVGNINRNQSRKRMDLCIRAFADFAKTRNNAYMLIHAVKSDPQGWDLPQLVRYYGLNGKVMFTHELFSDTTATIEQLNYIYNSCDVQVNTGGGEGWGLTNFEGAGAGIPQIVPDWSATKEIWEGSAKLIKVATVRHEPGQVNTMQATIDTADLNNILAEFYENPNLRETVGEACFRVTQRPEYKWENVVKKFDDVFKRIAGKVNKGVPVAVTTKGQIELQKKHLV